MDLRQLEAFVSVATLRSFRAAANRLNLTQPAVSLRLSALEAELGVQLFDRNGRTVRPTAKGLELLAYAEQVLDGTHKFKRAARSSEMSQKVRLGVTSVIVHAWLTELLAALKSELPHIVVELVVDTTPRLRSLLIAGGLDAAILMGSVHEAGLRNLSLGVYRTVWIAETSFAAAIVCPGRKLTIQELAKHPIISHARDSATYGSIEEQFRLHGLWPVQLSSSNSVEAILRIARSGLALGALSEACIAPTTSGLAVLPCELDLPSYEYVASYHLDSVGRIGMILAELALHIAQEVQTSALRDADRNRVDRETALAAGVRPSY